MPANKILKEDSRNVGVNINLHYKYFILPSTVIFNIKSLSGEKSASDVFRVFLNAAASLKNKTFTKVELYSKGKIKFFVKGTYFKQLGEEYGDQNVIYTIRTFPENLFLYDGTGAYQQWSGGWLGVISKKMVSRGLLKPLAMAFKEKIKRVGRFLQRIDPPSKK
jgi:hypothetical protein